MKRVQIHASQSMQEQKAQDVQAQEVVTKHVDKVDAPKLDDT